MAPSHPAATPHASSSRTARRPLAAVLAAAAVAGPLVLLPASSAVATAPAPAPRGLVAAAPGRAVAIAPVARAADAQAVLRGRLDARSRTAPLKGRLAAVVLARDTGKVLWHSGATTPVMPASLTKVATAVTAYRWLDPKSRLVTRAVRAPGSRNVVLIGGGDPMLAASDLKAMAATSAASLKRAKRTSVVVVVDDRLFPAPTNAPGWKKSYVPSEVSPVRSLLVYGREVADTGMDAGKLFAAALTKQGIKVTAVRRGKAAKGSVVLAAHSSPTIGGLVSRMLLASDNQIAETLYRLAARASGRSATWSNARRARDAALRGLGVTSGVDLVDGSGLSRSNRITAVGYARLLRAISANARYRPLLNGLPVAGVSGTLARRYATAPTSCAKADVSAKTGTLDDVVGLGGFARTTTGGTDVIVFLRTGKRTSTKAVTGELDKLATTVVGCW